MRDLLGGDFTLADEIMEMGTEKRRAALIDELEGIRQRMEPGDAELIARCKRMHKNMGFPDDMIESEYATLMEQYTVDPPDDNRPDNT